MDLCIYVTEKNRQRNVWKHIHSVSSTISSTKRAGGLREIWVFTVVTIEISDEWTYVSMSKELSKKCLKIYTFSILNNLLYQDSRYSLRNLGVYGSNY